MYTVMLVFLAPSLVFVILKDYAYVTYGDQVSK